MVVFEGLFKTVYAKSIYLAYNGVKIKHLMYAFKFFVLMKL